MKKLNWKKIVFTGLGLLASGVATVLANKVSEDEMKETVAKQVAETLANQAKES